MTEWANWEHYVRMKLLEFHETVSSTSRYQTFYVGEEADLFGFDCDYPNDWSKSSPDYIDARFYAVQYVLHEWDVIHSLPKMKPLLIVGAYDGGAWGLVKRVRAELVNARMVAMFDYPFKANLPAYPDSLQRSTTYTGQKRALDALRTHLDNFRNEFVSRSDIELWWVPQAFMQIDLYPNDYYCSGLRYPTYEELRIQVALALSRGVKGVLWNLYGSYDDSVSVKSGSSVISWPFGVVDGLHRSPIHHDKEPVNPEFAQPHPWRDCPDRAINPFGDLARVNAELNEIGPVFRKLDLVDVFDQSSIPPNCLGLRKVEATGKYGDEAIDVSIFRRYDCDSCWYIMLVNKILNDTDDPCHVAAAKNIGIIFDHKDAAALLEMKTGKYAPVSFHGGKALFAVELEPGQGNLYAVEGVRCTSFSTPDIPCCVSIACSPNPLRGVASIEYRLPVESEVRIELHDVLGRKMYAVNEGTKSAGTHSIPFTQTSNLSSGVYIVRLVSVSGTAWTKLSVMR